MDIGDRGDKGWERPGLLGVLGRGRRGLGTLSFVKASTKGWVGFLVGWSDSEEEEGGMVFSGFRTGHEVVGFMKQKRGKDRESFEFF